MAKETANSSNSLHFLFLISFLLMSVFSFGQTEKDPPKKIKHQHSEEIQVSPERFEGNPFAFGNVIFEHDGALLYSDSAVYYQNENLFVAWSNVRMINDTVSMRSDSLRYDGNTSLTKAFGNVHMKDDKSELFADYAEYDRKTDIASASGNVVMIDPSQRIETPLMIYERQTGIARTDAGAIIRGNDGTVTHTQILVYNANSKEVHFNQNTMIETPDYRINSDKMIMNQATDITVFLERTTITDRKNPRNYIVMPEGGGIFNKKTGEAVFDKRSVIYRNGKELWGDKMYFNEQTGFGWAKGDVFINDPEEKRYIRGEYGEVHRNVDSAFVTGKAYAVKAFKEDSLYFHADTIMVVKRPDSTRVLKAYFNARYFKSDAQGKSDSIFYNETQGLMQFYRDPIMWSGEQQITGDTIYAYNNPIKEVMDSVRVFNHAFAISKVDSLQTRDFNQVKGKYMTGYFLNNQLNLVEVHENAQSITFVDDENAETNTKERIGINLSDCGIIEAEINGNNVEVLACRIQASSRLYPESKLPPGALYLKDFKWRGDEKMTRWQDIFGDSTLIIESGNSTNSDTIQDGQILELDDFINSSEDSDENQSN
ncbi:MAG: OstA-like protein [Weeksellaceae bacterium]|jgi:lipopolysaccharide export system protein LptA|nr:OstA-like protein [Weeksellaceae bacterium]